MERLKRRRRELRNEDDTLRAEYKQLTNEYYKLMLKHIPKEDYKDADIANVESRDKKATT